MLPGFNSMVSSSSRSSMNSGCPSILHNHLPHKPSKLGNSPNSKNVLATVTNLNRHTPLPGITSPVYSSPQSRTVSDSPGRLSVVSTYSSFTNHDINGRQRPVVQTTSIMYDTEYDNLALGRFMDPTRTYYAYSSWTSLGSKVL